MFRINHATFNWLLDCFGAAENKSQFFSSVPFNLMSFENLYSFLCSLQLELYHEIFINAGVTDHDWHQFVQFTDEELEEFVSAVNMLPFHAIKFKKAIRKLHMPPETQSETSAEVPNDDNVSSFSFNTC